MSMQLNWHVVGSIRVSGLMAHDSGTLSFHVADEGNDVSFFLDDEQLAEILKGLGGVYRERLMVRESACPECNEALIKAEACAVRGERSYRCKACGFHFGSSMLMERWVGKKCGENDGSIDNEVMDKVLGIKPAPNARPTF